MMEEEFNEFNLVLMHMQAVSQIGMKSNQSPVLRLLHVNKLILKQRAVKPQEDNPPPPQDQPSTSTTHEQPVAPVDEPKGKEKERSKDPIQMEAVPEVIPVELPMQEEKKIEKITIGTQTDAEIIPLEPTPEEQQQERFNTFHAKSVRQQYLATHIIVREFDDKSQKADQAQAAP